MIFTFFYYTIMILGSLTFVSLFLYLTTQLYVNFMPDPNFQKKYKTKWALITGGTTGIGSEISNIFAKQGLNLFIVGLADKFLPKKITELSQKYPKQTFIPIGVDLSNKKFLEEVKKKTEKYDIGIVVSNAGMLLFKELDVCPIETVEKITNVNVFSGINLARYFILRWEAKKRTKALFTFTCSSSAIFCGPKIGAYAGGKSFLEHFCKCLYLEKKKFYTDIDICAFNPEYVKTNILAKTDQADMYEKAKWYESFVFKLILSYPRGVAERYVKCMGRISFVDSGGFSIISRLMFCSFWNEAVILWIMKTFFIHYKKKSK